MYISIPIFIKFIVALWSFSQVGELDAGLLSSERGNQVHKRRRKGIVSVQTVGLELSAHCIHALRVISLLNDRRHETGELRLLPSLLGGKLGVNEVQTVERVCLFDSAIHVDTAVAAGVTLDNSRWVDNLELGCVGLNREVITGNNADNGEQSTGRLPALRAATSVVVGNIALQGDNNLVRRATALKSATREVGVTLGDAVVDERMDRRRHDKIGLFIKISSKT